MHKGLRQIFTRYIISGSLPRPMQVQNKAESYLLFLGPSWKSPTRRWEPLICTCICVHWLGPCICFSWQNCLFVKKQNLKLALPVMHLPYSSLIFSWKGALKFVVNSAFIRFIKSKGNKKDSIAVLNASFLLSTYFVILWTRLTKVDFFPSSTSSLLWVGALWSISLVLKLDLVFLFARYLREEPQMVHFAMDSVCVDLPSPLTLYLLPTYYKSNT